jgi:hypothetical protein
LQTDTLLADANKKLAVEIFNDCWKCWDVNVVIVT